MDDEEEEYEQYEYEEEYEVRQAGGSGVQDSRGAENRVLRRRKEVGGSGGG